VDKNEGELWKTFECCGKTGIFLSGYGKMLWKNLLKTRE